MADVLVVYWEWTTGAHAGGKFWGAHSVSGDARLRDWQKLGLRPLGAARVAVTEGAGLDLVEAASMESGT